LVNGHVPSYTIFKERVIITAGEFIIGKNSNNDDDFGLLLLARDYFTIYFSCTKDF
jgi:hypothetical protein